MKYKEILMEARGKYREGDAVKVSLDPEGPSGRMELDGRQGVIVKQFMQPVYLVKVEGFRPGPGEEWLSVQESELKKL